jgi:hypothetical protein
MATAIRKLALVGVIIGILPVAGFAGPVPPPECETILSHMDKSVKTGGRTFHRYCGRYANGGEYLVVVYSHHGGRYTAYTASQSGQNIKPAPARLKNGVLIWHSVIPGVTRTVVVTYLLASNHVLTRIARGTEGPTIILKTDPLARM